MGPYGTLKAKPRISRLGLAEDNLLVPYLAHLNNYRLVFDPKEECISGPNIGGRAHGQQKERRLRKFKCVRAERAAAKRRTTKKEAATKKEEFPGRE
jgi:hypothetical protein